MAGRETIIAQTSHK